MIFSYGERHMLLLQLFLFFLVEKKQRTVKNQTINLSLRISLLLYQGEDKYFLLSRLERHSKSFKSVNQVDVFLSRRYSVLLRNENKLCFLFYDYSYFYLGNQHYPFFSRLIKTKSELLYLHSMLCFLNC